MPVPTFTKLGPQPEYNDLVNKINTLVAELQNLMLGVDSINVFEVGGWRVTLDQLASKDGDVGMSTLDTVADDIRFWAGDAISGSPKFTVTEAGILTAVDGNFTGDITGSTITGGTIQTATSGNNRIVITNNSLKTYNSSNQLQGFAWGTDVSGASYGDAFFYDAGNQMADFFNTVSDGLAIRPSSGYNLKLGVSGRSTFGRGTWEFSSGDSVDMKGTFKVHTGTAFDTITQADTSGLTLAQLETELNTLKANLRSMNILA